jgi:hypothetical protein
MIDFLNDQPSDLSLRVSAANAALALMNASAALARAKAKRMSNGKINREAVAAAKAELIEAQAAFDAQAVELASAYENAMVVVRNAVHGVDCKIPRYNVGSCCDPSMESYHSM